MNSNKIRNLFDAAKKVARGEDNPLQAVFDDDGICVLSIKVVDEAWDFKNKKLAMKSVSFLKELCNDLAALLCVRSAALLTLDGFIELYESQIEFEVSEGCIYFTVDLTEILSAILGHYSELLANDYESWQIELSASLLAFSTAMLGSASWYSLRPLLAIDYDLEEDSPIKTVLAYAQKIILGGQSTPEFLANVLSQDKATVSINNETPITAKTLREIKFKPDEEDVKFFYIDDVFTLREFSTTSVSAKCGKTFDHKLLIEKLDKADRERLGKIAERVVKNKRAEACFLQVVVSFKGGKYQRAWIEGFGPKRPTSIPVDSLFMDPKLFEHRKLPKVKIKDNGTGQLTLFKEDDNTDS